jgi:hypothetical protein
MTLDNWDPSAPQIKHSFQPDNSLLQRFIAISQNQQYGQLNTLLSPTEQQSHAKLMQLTKAQWFAAAAPFNDDDIKHLMRFFTVAEQLPGWEAGENSPVVWLGKVLKQRGTGISRELAEWIKSNSDNKFLPHGALI